MFKQYMGKISTIIFLTAGIIVSNINVKQVFASDLFGSQKISVSAATKPLAVKSGAELSVANLMTRILIDANDYKIIGDELKNKAPNLVRTYSLKNEKNSKVSYSADYQAALNKDAIENYLNGKNIKYLKNINSNYLILPVETNAAISTENKVWDDNFWSQAWKNYDASQFKYIDYKLPIGDFEDIANINVATLLSYNNSDAINSSLKKYNTDYMVLAQAIKSEDGTGLVVKISDLDSKQNRVLNFTIPVGQSDFDYNDVITKCLETVFDFAKYKSIIFSKQNLKMQLRFQITSLRDKVKIENFLNSVEGIDSVISKDSSTQTVNYEIIFNKEQEKKVLNSLLKCPTKLVITSLDILVDNTTDVQQTPVSENNTAVKTSSTTATTGSAEKASVK